MLQGLGETTERGRTSNLEGIDKNLDIGTEVCHGEEGEIQKTVSPSPWEVKNREREAEGRGGEQDIRSRGAARIQDRQRKVWDQLRLSNLKLGCSHMYGSALGSTSCLAARTHKPYLKLQLLFENKGLNSYLPLICLFHKHISFS